MTTSDRPDRPGRSGSAEPGTSGETHPPDDGLRDAGERRARARRRRHIDEVFGTVLPAVTEDEREPGERGGFSAEHYRRSRPPHYGG